MQIYKKYETVFTLFKTVSRLPFCIVICYHNSMRKSILDFIFFLAYNVSVKGRRFKYEYDGFKAWDFRFHFCYWYIHLFQCFNK